MDLAEQPEAQGELVLAEPDQPMVHSGDVVHDLFEVCRALLPLLAGLESEDVVERALGPLDLRAQDRLLAHVHRDEQVRVREDRGDTVEPPERAVRVGEQALEP